MKKLLFILFALTLALTGCTNKTDNYEDATEATLPTEEAKEEEVVIRCFIGTVTDEGDSYMCVEPDKGEAERKLSDEMVVFYNYLHTDYLYGIGRRVVVYYQSDQITPAFEIFTDDISTEGFRDFELTVEENGTTKFEKILNAENNEDKLSFMSNVSTYGVDVKVNVDGKSVSLKEAFDKNYITPQAIDVMANRDSLLGKAKKAAYHDGGSCEYTYDNYKIISYNTKDGKTDLYIGTLNMKYT